jgi:hypothetical protein
MAEESKIYNDDGKLIAVRYVEKMPDGSKRVTTQEAWNDWLGVENRGKYLDDRYVYADGKEYKK